MKAFIQDNKIYNFVPDNYVAGNKEIDGGTHPTIKILPIKGFDVSIDMEEVAKNKTRTDFGFFQYYLDDKGVVQKKGKGDVDYDEAYVASQKAKRAAEYPKEADGIFFKFQRGEATEQEWKDAVQKVKDKYPYEEVK